MRRSRFTEGQIIHILKEHEAGLPIADLKRKHGVSAQTFYRWKEKYGGLEVSEARRLKSLEDENRKLNQIVAELALDNSVLKEVIDRSRVGVSWVIAPPG